jgi:hypothetical protein
MKRTLSLLAGAALMVPAPALAREPIQLAPSSTWLVDYADERCTLVRDFAEGDQSLQLRIESFGSWRNFRFTVLGPTVPRSVRSIGDISIRFTPDEEDRETGAIQGSVGEQRGVSFSAEFGQPGPDLDRLSETERRQLFATPKPIEAEFERGVSSMLIEFDNGKTVQLALGGMSAPLKALRNCVDDLYKSWGMDPVVQRELSRLPLIKINTAREVQRSYPTRMLGSGGSAFVPVRVMVDQDGKATACVIQTGGVPKPFTDAVCEGLMGSYETALDEAGNPVPTVYSTAVIYLAG